MSKQNSGISSDLNQFQNATDNSNLNPEISLSSPSTISTAAPASSTNQTSGTVTSIPILQNTVQVGTNLDPIIEKSLSKSKEQMIVSSSDSVEIHGNLITKSSQFISKDRIIRSPNMRITRESSSHNALSPSLPSKIQHEIRSLPKLQSVSAIPLVGRGGTGNSGETNRPIVMTRRGSTGGTDLKLVTAMNHLVSAKLSGPLSVSTPPSLVDLTVVSDGIEVGMDILDSKRNLKFTSKEKLSLSRT